MSVISKNASSSPKQSITFLLSLESVITNLVLTADISMNIFNLPLYTPNEKNFLLDISIEFLLHWIWRFKLAIGDRFAWRIHHLKYQSLVLLKRRTWFGFYMTLCQIFIESCNNYGYSALVVTKLTFEDKSVKMLFYVCEKLVKEIMMLSELLMNDWLQLHVNPFGVILSLMFGNCVNLDLILTFLRLFIVFSVISSIPI